MTVLTVNAGSSSIRLVTLEQAGSVLERRTAYHGGQTPAEAEVLLRDFLAREPVAAVRAIAHRVVHGGERLARSCIIDDQIEAEIAQLAQIAPLHNPAALAWIRACRAVLGKDVPQVAVFDTAFYAELPSVARCYALPRALYERLNIRRYGFHGLAHEAMWRRWRALRPDASPNARVISVQLGAGCSITAMRDGRAVDTSMGFSPLEGLMMATRCGDLDPGLLLYLQRTLLMTPERMEQLLNEESGLLGVSGTSADMRALLTSNDAAGRFAVALYCYRARKYIGAYLAVLGGADAILFGGGVGENAPVVREAILGGMQWAHISLDAEANWKAVGVEAIISQSGDRIAHGSVEIWVTPVDESVILAEEALTVLSTETQKPEMK